MSGGVYEPAWLGDAPVPHWRWRSGPVHAIFSARLGGVGSPPWATCNVADHVGDDPAVVEQNRRRLAELVPCTSIALARQVHGSAVWHDVAEAPWRWDVPVEADALLVDRPGRAVAVLTADCLPIVVAAGDRVATVHAGWRGLAAGVLEAAIVALESTTVRGPRVAVVGPALGRCCFEVGADVAEAFASSSLHEGAGGVPMLDARADALRRLAEAGYDAASIDVCTRCDARCFSHRGDGVPTGRQAVIAWRSGA